MLRAAERGVLVEETEGGRLGDLYRRHAPDAGRLAYLLTGDRVLAKDVVQELDILIYTPGEYERMLAKENPLIERAERGGRILYERPTG